MGYQASSPEISVLHFSPPAPNYFLGKKLDEVESYTVISIAVFYKDFCVLLYLHTTLKLGTR